MSKFGWIVLTTAVVFPLAAHAETVEVTASALNIRSGPSTSFGRLGVASRGQRLTVQSRSGSWIQVDFNGRSGWGHGSYLRSLGNTGNTGSTTSSAAMEVTASRLNVRSTPSTSGRVVGSLVRGQRVNVVGSSGDWRKLDGGERWVHGSYLRAASGNTGGGNTGSSGTTRTVSASVLNVRSGPGTNYRTIGSLRGGTRVQVQGTSGSWSRIGFNGGTGWVHSNFLTDGSAGQTGSGGRVSRAGFVQFPSSGADYFGYYAASKRWGTPTMVYGIMRVARDHRRADPSSPRLGVGDISLENGGDISGHASHERGVDADFRAFRRDGVEGPVTIYQSTYDRARTQAILQRFERELPVTHIGFQDSQIRGVPHRRNWTNHANHYHIRTSR